MRRIIVLFMILGLAACEPNRYAAVEGVDNSSDARWAAWRSCEKEAVKNGCVYDGKPDEGADGCHLNVNSGVTPGAVVAGVAGGAIGGAIYGIATAAGNSNEPEKESPTRAYADKCMAAKGYIVRNP